MKVQKYTIRCISIAIFAFVAVSAQAQSFSVAPGGPSALPADDIFTPAGPPPATVFTGNGTGNVNAFSYGKTILLSQITSYDFSVVAGSVGAGGTAVNAESAGNDEPADIFNSTGNNNNVLVWDGDGSTGPNMGLIEQPNPSDETDGWDNGSPQGGVGAGPIYYSVDAAFPGAVPSDIYVDPTGNGYDTLGGPYAAAAQLGLNLNGTDDIDALVVFDYNNNQVFDGNDAILFSLVPNSPAFTAGGAYNALGPDDILFVDLGAGTSGLHLSATALGLNPQGGDDLDALDVVPEPAVGGLIALIAGGFLFIRRHFMI
jgi:hypothetical protein